MELRSASTTSFPREAVFHALQRVLGSPLFAQSDRRSRFLRYIVDETLAGRAGQLKGYKIGVDVFDKPGSFDPMLDPVVRVEAGRLRDKLRAYYAEHGYEDEIKIELPKGTYEPVFVTRSLPEANSNSPGSHAQNIAKNVPAFTTPLKPSLAVLPFVNLSGDPHQDYLVDGLTDNLITDLSKVSGLFVISRHSSFAHKGSTQPVAELATILDVRYIVEGSVRRVGDRVRISAGLIDTERDYTIWAERYDRTITDIFDLQDEVSRNIVQALKVKLTPLESDRLGHHGSSNIKANDELLKGVQRYWKYTAQDHVAAFQHFVNAIAIDDNFATAHAWLARTYVFQYCMAWAKDPQHAIETAMAHAQRAVELDDLLPYAHAILGWTLLWQSKWDKAEDAGRRACSLDPNSADAHMFAGVTLACAGNFEQGLGYIENSINLNPHPSSLYFWALGATYFCGGEYERCIAAMRKGIEFNRMFMPCHGYLAVTLALTQRHNEAIQELREWADIAPGFMLSSQKHPLTPRLQQRWDEGYSILLRLFEEHVK